MGRLTNTKASLVFLLFVKPVKLTITAERLHTHILTKQMENDRTWHEHNYIEHLKTYYIILYTIYKKGKYTNTKKYSTHSNASACSSVSPTQLPHLLVRDIGTTGAEEDVVFQLLRQKNDPRTPSWSWLDLEPQSRDESQNWSFIKVEGYGRIHKICSMIFIRWNLKNKFEYINLKLIDDKSWQSCKVDKTNW